jgi:hypothetical protein
MAQCAKNLNSRLTVGSTHGGCGVEWDASDPSPPHVQSAAVMKRDVPASSNKVFTNKLTTWKKNFVK